jgi:hypothetical protein
MNKYDFYPSPHLQVLSYLLAYLIPSLVNFPISDNISMKFSQRPIISALLSVIEGDILLKLI